MYVASCPDRCTYTWSALEGRFRVRTPLGSAARGRIRKCTYTWNALGGRFRVRTPAGSAARGRIRKCTYTWNALGGRFRVRTPAGSAARGRIRKCTYTWNALGGRFRVRTPAGREGPTARRKWRSYSTSSGEGMPRLRTRREMVPGSTPAASKAARALS